jgi:signal transduction histidine kinase
VGSQSITKLSSGRGERWNVALGAIAAALVIRWTLEPILIDRSPFLLFAMAVMVASIYGGRSAAILATSLGCVAGLHFLSTAGGLRSLLEPSDLLQVVLYLAVCTGIVHLVDALRESRRRAEQAACEQAALAEKLGQADQAKDQFLAMVSHELRNPLNAIVGWSALLAQGQLDAGQARSAIDTIERNARLQNQLVSDLLDVSRIVTGTLHLQMDVVDSKCAIEDAVNALRPAALMKGVALDLVVERAGSVYADPERLQQILWNLLSNAIKFTPGGGHVVIGVRAVRNAVLISVEDDGPGIPKDLLPHVFERFRQGNPRTGGLGLGLAIVRELVEKHGGTIRATNGEEGHGARFEFVLARIRDVETRPGSASAMREDKTPPLDEDHAAGGWLGRSKTSRR